MISRIAFGLSTLAFALLFAGTASAGGSTVSYQGELLVDGEPYTGPADFKFVINKLGGGPTQWSNDGTSNQGGEPTSAVTLDVDDGIFSVLLGLPPMVPLTSDLIASNFNRALRIWVDSGAGFEQLPDQRISASAFALHSDSAERAHGSFTAGGMVESTAGGFKFPDGTIQTTSAEAIVTAPDLRLQLVSSEFSADAGNNSTAVLLVAVSSPTGPVLGLGFNDFDITVYLVPAGGNGVTIQAVIILGLNGVYRIQIAPSPGFNWVAGRYLQSVEVSTPDGTVTGVVALDIDI